MASAKAVCYGSSGRHLNWIDKLLGRNEEGRIIPAIEITTDKGVVTIPVNEVVEFEEKTEDQGKEKAEDQGEEKKE